MSMLKTSLNSSIRIGTVGPAEVESSTATLGNGASFMANADMAATWATVLFVASIIFLYILL